MSWISHSFHCYFSWKQFLKNVNLPIFPSASELLKLHILINDSYNFSTDAILKCDNNIFRIIPTLKQQKSRNMSSRNEEHFAHISSITPAHTCVCDRLRISSKSHLNSVFNSKSWSNRHTRLIEKRSLERVLINKLIFGSNAIQTWVPNVR